jgi:DNA-binding NarL/FixJ family response regulator
MQAGPGRSPVVYRHVQLVHCVVTAAWAMIGAVADLPARVIVLSSRTSIGDKISALDAGADDYVTEPFAMGELVALIPRAGSTLDPERAAAMLFRDYFLTLGQLSPAISEAAYQTARRRQGPELTDNDRLMILSIIALGEIREAIWQMDLQPPGLPAGLKWLDDGT